MREDKRGGDLDFRLKGQKMKVARLLDDVASQFTLSFMIQHLERLALC
jgi:hypothetical protein